MYVELAKWPGLESSMWWPDPCHGGRSSVGEIGHLLLIQGQLPPSKEPETRPPEGARRQEKEPRRIRSGRYPPLHLGRSSACRRGFLFFQRGYIPRVQAQLPCLQQPPHNLARAGFGQRRCEVYLRGHRDGA